MKLTAWLLAGWLAITGGLYLKDATVTATDAATDTVTATDAAGEDWAFGWDGLAKGDAVRLLMHDNGTPEYPYDDMVVYVGVVCHD